jgi:glycosyltransferase involved in cell wall biosynthesis
MQEQPLFSVIMPNFNNGKYIKEAIESVLAQTYPNWELVIVDDASTDNSLDIIKVFMNNGKIKLITNDINKGVANAARLAVENSSGEIIGTLDSDDVLVEDALMVMVDEHRNSPEHGLIYSNHYICDKNLGRCREAAWIGPLPDDMCLQDVFLGSQDGMTVSTHFRTFKRSAYDKTEGYDIALLCYEDRDLYYKLDKVTEIKGINRCLCSYRHDDEMGAYRRNPKEKYYWFLCEYKEVKRRFGVNLPFVNKAKISPFLSNIMYLYLYKYSKISKERLRRRLQTFLLEMGHLYLKSNKLLAFLYFLNSLIYGYTSITFTRIRKFITPELLGK